MKCNNCRTDKPLTDFYRDKNGYIRKVCKKCTIAKSRENQRKNHEYRKQYCREYHKKNRERRVEGDRIYKSQIDALKTPCCKCGDARLYVIDFHHVDPGEKSFNINRKKAKSDFSIIENEVKKCVCLCRNCHMEFHHFYGQKPKNPVQALNDYLKGDFKNETV